MNSREEKREIAKIAFLEIEKAMDKIREEFPGIEFHFCWDECMHVDDEFFASRSQAFSEDHSGYKDMEDWRPYNVFRSLKQDQYLMNQLASERIKKREDELGRG